MNIIIDTREQKPLTFTGHETTRRKLEEGDYNTIELEDKIVIERKGLEDLYQSITHDHARFKREILRAKEKQKAFYIFIEGELEDFILNYTRESKPITVAKILLTMVTRYDLRIVQCLTRDEMSKKIIALCEEKS
jgi:ERCC4-type nuclease